MLEANNTDYFNVSGIQINDPSINEDSVMIYCKFLHPPANHLLAKPEMPQFRLSPFVRRNASFALWVFYWLAPAKADEAHTEVFAFETHGILLL